jgi:dihydrofolate reductase
MRKLILKMSVSIDGFVGGKNGEIDWLIKTLDDSSTAWIVDTLWQAGVHIMGSHTFNDMIAYWPYSTEPFAAPMNEIPKIVFSKKRIDNSNKLGVTTGAFKDSSVYSAENGLKDNTITSPGTSWTNAEIISGDLETEINRLKQQPGKDLLAHGGAGFAQSLAKLNLIDEYRLLIHPVALRQGLPLFSALPNQLYLKLISTTVFDSGIVAHVYRLA